MISMEIYHYWKRLTTLNTSRKIEYDLYLAN